MTERCAEQCAKQCVDQLPRIERLPSFICYPNGTVLCVLKQKQSLSLIETDIKLNKQRVKQHARQLKVTKQQVPFDFISHPTGIVLRVLNQKRSTLLTEIATNNKCAAQHAVHRADVIQSDTISQHGTRSNRQQHYSHDYYRPPKIQ